MAMTTIAEARSLHIVPGYQPARFDQALVSSADAVILDLEDAVPAQAKPAAREAIRQAWAYMAPANRARMLVRINPARPPAHAADLELLQALIGLGGIVIPKAEGASCLERPGSCCPGTALLPLLETAEGMARIDEVARTPSVVRLGFGHIDLQADLSMACGDDEAELAPARWSLVVASRRAGLAPPVDGVTVSTTDADAVHWDTALENSVWPFERCSCSSTSGTSSCAV